MKLAAPVWGFLAERLDHRIAVSPDAATTVQKYLPGEYEVIPNGVAMPQVADPGERENRIVFVGRHEPRKGLQVLLRAWPEIRRQTGARLAWSAPTRSRFACC
jgi:phosphatidylinositol alpha-mannosyltransferase